jgi:hypothetical protein
MKSCKITASTIQLRNGSRPTRHTPQAALRNHRLTKHRKPQHGLTDLQAKILIFLYEHRGVLFREWPQELRASRTLATLKRRKLIVQRPRFPRRPYLTQFGSDLAHWVSALRHFQRNSTEGGQAV